ncbi:amidase [Rhodococcoides yunnanense]|uniref:amidase n=1 Tax=Rhodococcoides yunnanense TaxID=278209 RepID=A0ABU4BIG1_9NOCA|nr:amidase family protein [Rhodococcus yunnanensis]MDV6263970.1 amidase family protein [Rhodococcus yunnanensis]
MTTTESGLTQHTSDLTWKSADELRHLYAGHEVSPVEVARAHLDRIGRCNDQVNAYVTVTEERALADARAAERMWLDHNDASPAPLLGVPFALKDLVPTAGIRTAKGSQRFHDWVPEKNSPLAERMLSSGGVFLGKTTTSEMGWKADSGNRVNGPARNPHSLSHTAGGSSGGAAAAVAAGMATLAQGGDGAGSVRIPAAFCGVVGIKPSTGVIPYFPPTPLGSMVANGPLARTVADAALLLDALSGPDYRDPTSLTVTAGGYRAACDRPTRALRIAYIPELGGRAPEKEVADAVAAAVARLSSAGHHVDVVDTTPRDRFDLLHVIWTTGFASLFPGGGIDLDPGLAAVIDQASQFTGSDLAAAHLAREHYKAAISDLLAPYDIAITPTVSVPAFEAGADHPVFVDGESANYLDWAWLTYTFNLSEHPAISLPCASTLTGLPIGIQLIGRHHRDRDLIAAAASIESIVGIS